MNITPCRTCRFSPDCDLKRAKIKGVRGLGLTAIQFRCDKKRESLKPGMVALVKFKYVDSAGSDGLPNYKWRGAPDDPRKEPETKEGHLLAIVMKWEREGKVYVFVPRQSRGCLTKSGGDEQLHIAKVQHNVIEPTGETATVCDHCGMPECATDEERGTWVCRMEPSHYSDYQTGYLAQPIPCRYAAPAPRSGGGM